VPKGTQAVQSKVLGLRELMLLPRSEFEVLSVEGKNVRLRLVDDGVSFVRRVTRQQRELDGITKDAGGVPAYDLAKFPETL
jgi:hypothetical protein